MTMGSWLAREVAIIVVVVVVVVVGVRALFKVELGTAVAIAVGFVIMLSTISLVQSRKPVGDSRGSGDVALQSTGQYTGDQFARLEPGMSAAQVDAIMGGGGQSSKSETDGSLVRQYMNQDGSNVTVSFLDGKMVTKAMVGL